MVFSRTINCFRLCSVVYRTLHRSLGDFAVSSCAWKTKWPMSFLNEMIRKKPGRFLHISFSWMALPLTSSLWLSKCIKNFLPRMCIIRDKTRLSIESKSYKRHSEQHSFQRHFISHSTVGISNAFQNKPSPTLRHLEAYLYAWQFFLCATAFKISVKSKAFWSLLSRGMF